MTTEQILAGNKLIAEFMGGIYSNHAKSWGFGNAWINENPIRVQGILYEKAVWAERFEFELKYHESWNDLMPVVEKIENLGYSVEIFKSASHLEPDKIWHRCVIEKMTNWNIKLSSGECDDETGKQYIKTENKILSAWLAVVEFIKWYNLNNKSNETS